MLPLSARRSCVVMARRRFSRAHFFSSATTTSASTNTITGSSGSSTTNSSGNTSSNGTGDGDPIQSSASFREPLSPVKEEEEKVGGQWAQSGQELLLYKGNKGMYIKSMLGLAGFNICYWGTIMASNVYYQGMVSAQGVELAGNPIWGYVGGVASGLILYVTRLYARNSVYKAYISADGERLGFQMHTILGEPGKKVEVAMGNAQFVQNRYTKEELGGPQRGLLSTTAMPVKVQGLDFNLLLDRQGSYLENARIFDLLLDPGKHVNLENKSERQAWKKGVHKAHKSNRRS